MQDNPQEGVPRDKVSFWEWGEGEESCREPREQKRERDTQASRETQHGEYWGGKDRGSQGGEVGRWPWRPLMLASCPQPTRRR